MQWVRHFLRDLNTLSIDVSIGALIGACLYANLLGVILTFAEIACLGCTVWFIYTADHLFDAYTINPQASTHRHRFHYYHHIPIIAFSIFVFFIILVLLFYIRKPILYAGFILITIVGLYFIFYRFVSYGREFLVALLYCCGVWLPSFSLYRSMPPIPILLSMLLFMIVVLTNLIFLAWFDRKQDYVNKRFSLTVIFGTAIMRRMSYALLATQTILILYGFIEYHDYWLLFVVFLCMAITLTFIFFRPYSFMKDDMYRIAGDSIFMFPMWYIIFT